MTASERSPHLPPADERRAPAAPDFEQALIELEAIVHDLEEGDLGLTAMLARYERGVGLLKQCYELLEQAERRIEVLTGVDAEGNPVTEPFEDPGDASLDEKAQARSQRRSARRPRRRPDADASGPPPRDIDESGGLF